MQRRLRLTTPFVTHAQVDAMTCADRMAELDKGVVQQLGAPEALHDAPANAFLAGFVSTMNLLPARLLRRNGDTMHGSAEGLGNVQLPAPSAATAASYKALLLRVHPHALRVDAADAPPTGRSAQCGWLQGAVEASEFLGAVTRDRSHVGLHPLAVDHPHRAVAACTRRAVARNGAWNWRNCGC